MAVAQVYEISEGAGYKLVEFSKYKEDEVSKATWALYTD